MAMQSIQATGGRVRGRGKPSRVMETPAAVGRTIKFSQVPGKELDEYCGREDGYSIDGAAPEMGVRDAQ